MYMELKGIYNSAIVFTENIEEGAIEQIINLLDQDFILPYSPQLY